MRARVNPVQVLRGVMEPLGRCLSVESARHILALRADATAQRRVERLARKCDQGQLTPEERAEYQLYVEVGDFVAILQAKARRFLAAQPRT